MPISLTDEEVADRLPAALGRRSGEPEHAT